MHSSSHPRSLHPGVGDRAPLRRELGGRISTKPGTRRSLKTGAEPRLPEMVLKVPHEGQAYRYRVSDLESPTGSPNANPHLGYEPGKGFVIEDGAKISCSRLRRTRPRHQMTSLSLASKPHWPSSSAGLSAQMKGALSGPSPALRAFGCERPGGRGSPGQAGPALSGRPAVSGSGGGSTCLPWGSRAAVERTPPGLAGVPSRCSRASGTSGGRALAGSPSGQGLRAPRPEKSGWKC